MHNKGRPLKRTDGPHLGRILWENFLLFVNADVESLFIPYCLTFPPPLTRNPSNDSGTGMELGFNYTPENRLLSGACDLQLEADTKANMEKELRGKTGLFRF
ncbi:hypothetical protein TNIN_253591 [Trichonephila inaurata madagascariensis]|uniref:Uncharacterized protein n=1 Tax=Trichonephila inaurata madagascariensis TaxID=2747483 RepID=A0A8X7CL46_9ARAC|nr:hypothetical protein TNIN_253591 [Trichonephila inaurata madagascariensis]